VDWAIYVGSLGMFLTMLFLFIRVLPMISIFEMRTIVPPPTPALTPAESGAPAGD
jgi:molybdopterin-containing oxidoreductase family membrane subunit